MYIFLGIFVVYIIACAFKIVNPNNPDILSKLGITEVSPIVRIKQEFNENDKIDKKTNSNKTNEIINPVKKRKRCISF